ALAGADAVATYSAVAAIGAALATVVQVVVGYVADRRRAQVGHRREFLVAGVAGAVPALVWFYLAPNVAQFAAAFFILQTTLNVAIGPYQAAIPDYVPPNRRGEASSWMSAWQSLGNATGLIVVVAIGAGGVVAAILSTALVAAFAVTYWHIRALPAQPIVR